jgi:alanine racemase
MKHSRRAFLASAPLSVLATKLHGSPTVTPSEAQTTSSFDPWVEVNEKLLRQNVASIARLAANRPILAVIKNNGYGMGVTTVGRLLDTESAVDGLAVVKLQEAVALRDAGVEKPIVLMGPFDEANLGEAVARGITPMVYQPIGDAIDRIASRTQQPVGIQVCVDTGMGRVGVPHGEAAELIRDLAAREGVRIDGVMTTLTEDYEFDREQLRRLEGLCESLTVERVPIGRRHAVSSYGLFQHPDKFLDMVRPGMAIYGVYSAQQFRGSETLALTPALSLKARVIYVKRLEAGDSAGYERAFRATKPVWIATIPVGHTDGLPRVAANGGKLRIGSRLYPVIASVSASHCMVALGDEKSVNEGDVVSIFDERDGSRPEDLSKDCGASVYDLTMHLNPLLPRKVV